MTVNGLDGTELIASYANVDIGDLVVSARIPKGVAYLAARDLVKTLIGIALMLLTLSAIASIVGSRRITRPVERLGAAAREIGKGRFDVQVQVGSNDEMGMLAGSFNQMASELQDREVALKEAQAQLVQSEKMAAFGQLGAGIAHEVKNPLAGILGCAQIALRKVEESSLKKNLELIEKETRRCKTIVENLLKFARKDKVRLEAVDMNQVVKDAVAIVNHQLELHKVKLSCKLIEDVPYIMGNSNQLQQVLMNLMINAQQAMEGQAGSIAVSTRMAQDDRIEVKVSDTGPGIPEEMWQRIFEPFFTTKPGGKGTGLGLSVSYGIIKEHKGDIHVESRVGEGCTFVITIPIVKEKGTFEPDARVA
jgi:signal transduction histidine kinase